MPRWVLVVLCVAITAGADPAPRLSIKSLEPAKGDPDGGTYVRISGSRFIADGPRSAKVFFGARQGTVVRFASDAELIVEAPGGTPGQAVDVRLIFEPGGELKLPHAFTFVAAPPRAPARAITPRTQLPKAIQPMLPKHGIYAAGGGLTSVTWRVVLDADKPIVHAGTNSKPNMPAFEKLEHTADVAIAAADVAKLLALGNAAWSEPAPSDPSEPTADYDEVLIVVDGDDAFYLEGYGPIRRPKAADAISALRRAGKL